jgi:hypothetical protein
VDRSAFTGPINKSKFGDLSRRADCAGVAMHCQGAIIVIMGIVPDSSVLALSIGQAFFLKALLRLAAERFLEEIPSKPTIKIGWT